MGRFWLFVTVITANLLLFPAQAKELSVGTYIGSRFDMARALQAVALMNHIVGTSESADDTACPVHFQLRSFTEDPRMPRIIGSQADLRIARSLGYDIAIVSAIRSCGSVGLGLVGCSPLGHKGAVVVDTRNPMVDGSLWAHEYGHVRGLNHSSNSTGIMHPGLRNKFQLSANECRAF